MHAFLHCNAALHFQSYHVDILNQHWYVLQKITRMQKCMHKQDVATRPKEEKKS